MTQPDYAALADLAAAFRGPELSVMEPATGTVLARLPSASPADVDAAAEKAMRSQRAWAQLPFDQRAAVLRQAADLLRERAPAFNRCNVQECGSTAFKADWEVQASWEQLHAAASLAGQPHGYLIPSAVPGRTNMWTRVPIGVVGVIAPWNYPLLLAMRSVAPALAVGNAVLLKPALQGSLAGGLLLQQLFTDAGMPDGVFQVLPGEADTGAALVEHALVGMISFTGSTGVGRRIGEVCGRLLKKVALELGGNNAFVVLDDADIELAAAHGVMSAFLHQGQICMQGGRHLVHERVVRAYTEALVAKARALKVGDPGREAVQLGPLISESQCAKVQQVVDESVAQGARVLAGGRRDGLFFPATVLGDVQPSMAAFAAEIFGPVAPITPFASDAQLVGLVNASDYGLSAGIHTADVARGLAIARQLRTGMVHINDQTVNAEFNVPFGGMGASGNGGRFGGPANAEEFTQSQWISMAEKPQAYPF